MTWDSLFFMELQRLGGKTPVISSNSWQRYSGQLARSACISDEKHRYSGGIDVGG
jgi:hypothetical protein